MRLAEDSSFASKVSSFLRELNTGITGIESEQISWKEVLERIQTAPQRSQWEALAEIEKEQLKDRLYFETHTQYQNTEGNIVNFTLNKESDGIQRLIQLLPVLIMLESESRVIIVDELERSFHTNLTQWFFDKVMERVSGTSNRCQFVCTTHDTHLIDPDKLRLDEIWFMDRKNGETCINRLTDYKISEKWDLEKGYLYGRFGGVPVFM